MNNRLYVVNAIIHLSFNGRDDFGSAYEFQNGVKVSRCDVDDWFRDTGFKVNRMKFGRNSYHFIFPNDYEMGLFRVRFGV